MDEVDIKESWNKKRIFVAIFLAIGFAIGIYFVKNQLLGDKTTFINNSSDPSRSVKGVSEREEKNSDSSSLNVDLPKVLKKKIESLKQDVSSLNIAEIASSSPQVQKIINDIKALEQYPTNQARELCKQICSF